jgi:hypothetical protein
MRQAFEELDDVLHAYKTQLETTGCFSNEKGEELQRMTQSQTVKNPLLVLSEIRELSKEFTESEL